ncbi:MAG: sigma-54 dependent transcriptional regulator [Pseudomonadota bacterium]|nr:sigma-54 dependent transcriptional regulator [Pseudomonadota bacterium]
MTNSAEQPLVGDAPAFRRVLKSAQVVAATDASVLLLGESGTGKEVFARDIHRQSRRAQGSFVAVNCAGISEESIDSELSGRRDQTAGGTLFLDEVAELHLSGQAKLLRFLEGQRQTDTRIIAASHRDLWAAVERGDFRRDLYYRLYVVPLELPPLRERVQDIALLLEHFLRLAAEEHGLEPPRFTPTAERLLRRYTWPGNVRELRNLCERMLILRSGCDVTPENLPWEIRRGDVAADEGLTFKLPASGINLRDLEVEVIRQALALAGGNKSRAARLLGLTRDTLLYRMQKYLIKV